MVPSPYTLYAGETVNFCTADFPRFITIPMSPTLWQMHQTTVAMPDGRHLTYYDFGPRQGPSGNTDESSQALWLEVHRGAAREHPPGPERILPHPPEMRWDPVRGEWVIYAAYRMNRPQLPERSECPLCPGGKELPLPYQVAIFENQNPSLCRVPESFTKPEADSVFSMSTWARGHCDMVVYTMDHDCLFCDMPVNSIACLVEAWRARYQNLIERPEVKYVAIVENRGREAGMTLDHPHGQIYALPFVPPVLQAQWNNTLQFGSPDTLWDRVIEKELQDEVRVIACTPGILAAVPYFARHPYEVHIWARRPGVHSLLEMHPEERRELAAVLKNVTLRYHHLWTESRYGFPTLMLMQQISQMEQAQLYRFHIELYPLARSPQKLKYRASIETGTGTYLNDAYPEAQAAQLRATQPLELEWPDICFADHE